jgi:hypothetical protein
MERATDAACPRAHRGTLSLSVSDPTEDSIEAMCARLKLSPVPLLFGKVLHRGLVEGVEVSLHRDSESYGLEHGGRIQMRVTLPRPLDLGLAVQPAMNVFSDPSRFGTGDDAFDGIFVRRCAPEDASLAVEVLDPVVRGAMRDLAARGVHLELHDDAFVCTGPARPTESEGHLRALVSAARAIHEVVGRLPPPAALRAEGVSDALERTALALGLSCEKHPLTIHGATGTGDALRVRFLVHPTGRPSEVSPGGPLAAPGFDVALTFSEPLETPLELQAATVFERLRSALGWKDLQVFDPAFDSAFTIHAPNPEHARAVLNPSARTLLRRLLDLGLRLRLDARGLHGHGPLLTSGSDGTALLQSLHDLRPALRATLHDGPYR